MSKKIGLNLLNKLLVKRTKSKLKLYRDLNKKLSQVPESTFGGKQVTNEIKKKSRKIVNKNINERGAADFRWIKIRGRRVRIKIKK